MKIVKGLFSGFYATVANNSYGDEWEIKYFQKQNGKWTLKDGDLNSPDAEDMILVTAYPDKWGYFTFGKWQTSFCNFLKLGQNVPSTWKHYPILWFCLYFREWVKVA